MENNLNTVTNLTRQNNYKGFLIDLVIYISVMFLVREIYIPKIGFLANGLFWSFTTLVVATWRMKVRNVTWKELGLCKPTSFWRTLGVSAIILATVVISMVAFEIIKDLLPFSIVPDTSTESAVSKFGDLKGNWSHFFLIIPLVLVESFLEKIETRVHRLVNIKCW